jgi:hypothetical protein
MGQDTRQQIDEQHQGFWTCVNRDFKRMEVIESFQIQTEVSSHFMREPYSEYVTVNMNYL